MRELFYFLMMMFAGVICAFVIYPFAVIKSFITRKHDTGLETMGYGDFRRGCFIANYGLLVALSSVLIRNLL